MKKDEIKVGGTYYAKVTDRVVPIRIDRENSRGGWDATNLVTNKQIRIKSAQRLRGPAERGSKAKTDQNAKAEAAPETEPKSAAKVETPAEPAATTKQPKPAKAGKKISGLDAACQVLQAKGEPMRCGDLVEQMISTGLWQSGGKTPAATLYSAILREIQVKGSESRFKKTDRGLFTLTQAK